MSPIASATRHVGPSTLLAGAAGLDRRAAVRLELLLGAALVTTLALGLYVWRLAPDVGFWDTGMFQAAIAALGLPHSTGYPLYVMLGKVFAFAVFWGDDAYAANLFSAVTAALAVGALYLLARLLAAGPIAAAAGALGFGLSQIVWRTAVRADPHTLHVLLAVTIVAGAILWHRRGHPERLLNAISLGYGLALGNHLLTGMLAPALGVFVLLAQPGILRQPRRILVNAGLIGVGLLVYLFVVVRALVPSPLNHQYVPDSWAEFWRFVTGADFQGTMGFLSADGPGLAVRSVPGLLEALVFSLGGGALALLLLAAVVGLGVLVRRDRAVAIFLSLAALVPLYASLTYPNGDIARYYFTTLAIVCALGAVGASVLIGPGPTVAVDPLAPETADREASAEGPSAERRTGEPRGSEAPIRRGLALAPLMLLLLPASLVSLNADRVATLSAACFVDAVFARVESGAVILSWWNYSTPLMYARYGEGERSDVEIVNGIDAVPQELETRVGGARPLYLIQPHDRIEDLGSVYDLQPLGVPCGEEVYRVLGRAS